MTPEPKGYGSAVSDALERIGALEAHRVRQDREVDKQAARLNVQRGWLGALGRGAAKLRARLDALEAANIPTPEGHDSAGVEAMRRLTVISGNQVGHFARLVECEQQIEALESRMDSSMAARIEALESDVGGLVRDTLPALCKALNIEVARDWAQPQPAPGPLVDEIACTADDIEIDPAKDAAMARVADVRAGWTKLPLADRGEFLIWAQREEVAEDKRQAERRAPRDHHFQPYPPAPPPPKDTRDGRVPERSDPSVRAPFDRVFTCQGFSETVMCHLCTRGFESVAIVAGFQLCDGCVDKLEAALGVGAG